MRPEPGEHLMLWTVRASVGCYVVALWRWLFAQVPAESTGSAATQSGDRVYNRFWFAAWLLCVLHVICAFHFRHHWVHSVAIQHTADMTERVVGIHWGGGLYVNYVFLLCWGASVAGALRHGRNQTVRGRRLENIMHAFAAFMMFNATAVFGPLWWWIPTIAIVAAIAYRIRIGGRLNAGI